MIYFDIHGVVCDILKPMGANPVTWHFKSNGLTLVEFYDRNLELLETAPETEYCKTIQNWLRNIDTCQEVPRKSNLPAGYVERIPTFLSCCKGSWQPHVIGWLGEHFPIHVRSFVDHPDKKLDILKKGDLLVEDYPGFPDYSQIILIDRPYNQGVKCDRRVYNTDDLLRKLDNVPF